MFFKKRKFKVKLKGRSEIIYEVEQKKLVFQIDSLSGDVDFVVYIEKDLRWETPYDTETISEEDKVKIKVNVTNDLKKHSIKIRWTNV